MFVCVYVCVKHNFLNGFDDFKIDIIIIKVYDIDTNALHYS